MGNSCAPPPARSWNSPWAVSPQACLRLSGTTPPLLHLAGKHVMQRAAAAFRAIDRDGVPFDKGRAEERKALDVIPVRMSEEDVRANGSLALGHQLGGQPVRAGAAVKNQKVAVGSGQLDAGRIAAEVIRAGPGGGDRPPRSPEPYSHEPRLSCVRQLRVPV